MRLVVVYISLICGALSVLSLQASAQTAATPKATPPKVELTANEKALLSQGYRLEVRNGEKTFCRREVVLGSHFEKKVCGTADQLAATTLTSREMLQRVQEHGTNPTGN